MLTGSRPATEAEVGAMAPVLAELCGRGVDIDALYVRRVQRPSTPVAVAIAHRAMVVTPGLVESTYRGGVSVSEAAAVLAQGSAGAGRSGRGWRSRCSRLRPRGGW